MGIDENYEAAVAKALIASNMMLPKQGSILLSIRDEDKVDAISLIKNLHEMGYDFFATEGTSSVINDLGLSVVMVPKILDGTDPNVVDIINNGTVDAVINTVTGDREVMQDGFHIRRAAVDRRIPCFTSLDTARMAVETLVQGGVNFNVKTVQEYITNEGK
jgi:carbamoyl-phosphate synthase large subunit